MTSRTSASSAPSQPRDALTGHRPAQGECLVFAEPQPLGDSGRPSGQDGCPVHGDAFLRPVPGPAAVPEHLPEPARIPNSQDCSWLGKGRTSVKWVKSRVASPNPASPRAAALSSTTRMCSFTPTGDPLLAPLCPDVTRRRTPWPSAAGRLGWAPCGCRRSRVGQPQPCGGGGPFPRLTLTQVRRVRRRPPARPARGRVRPAGP